MIFRFLIFSHTDPLNDPLSDPLNVKIECFEDLPIWPFEGRKNGRKRAFERSLERLNEGWDTDTANPVKMPFYGLLAGFFQCVGRAAGCVFRVVCGAFEGRSDIRAFKGVQSRGR